MTPTRRRAEEPGERAPASRKTPESLDVGRIAQHLPKEGPWRARGGDQRRLAQDILRACEPLYDPPTPRRELRRSLSSVDNLMLRTKAAISALPKDWIKYAHKQGENEKQSRILEPDEIELMKQVIEDFSTVISSAKALLDAEIAESITAPGGSKLAGRRGHENLRKAVARLASVYTEHSGLETKYTSDPIKDDRFASDFSRFVGEVMDQIFAAGDLPNRDGIAEAIEQANRFPLIRNV